jgi:hypothetical protein
MGTRAKRAEEDEDLASRSERHSAPPRAGSEFRTRVAAHHLQTNAPRDQVSMTCPCH